jgi:hypothetical protein
MTLRGERPLKFQQNTSSPSSGSKSGLLVTGFLLGAIPSFETSAGFCRTSAHKLQIQHFKNQFLPIKTLRTFIIAPIRATCLAHLIWSDDRNNTIAKSVNYANHRKQREHF